MNAFRFCLFVVLRPAPEYFAQIMTSPLQRKAAKEGLHNLDVC